MIPTDNVKEIEKIWDNYVTNNKLVFTTKGKELPDIDKDRLKCIADIKMLIEQFNEGKLNIYEFKTSLDSYNKRNNLWGFTATKGQMFFNQLTKTNERDIEKLSVLLKQSISEPNNLAEALQKIERFEKFVSKQYLEAQDKRKFPNPGSIGYFLTYFWQLHNPQKWPIIYTSLIKSFGEIGIWDETAYQKEGYAYFYNLNEEIKSILTRHSRQQITNWDAEHAFWSSLGKPSVGAKAKSRAEKGAVTIEKVHDVKIEANFKLEDYLIPKIKDLKEIGSQTEKASSAKGSEYEKMAAEIFKYLEFDIQFLGQGSGRNPDIILRYHPARIAFIVDAKAYGSGYSLGIDDRAIKEYIDRYCPILQKEGFRKIGFIIVSNSFKSNKSNFDSFINEITWNTEIKRFILLTSEALLYLFAYKMKDKLSLDVIVEKLVGCGNLVEASNIIEEFEDV